MDFALTTEQRDLRRDVVAFARKELGSRVVEDDRDCAFAVADWRKCAEFGVLGWPVPVAYGGRGLDPESTMVALDALGYGCVDNGLVFAVNNHLWGCVIYLLLHGDERQRREFLPSLCDGTLVGAHALSEPEAGSDVLALSTTAERDGDSYLLRGTKTFVSNGTTAGVFVVLARTGGPGGPQNQLSAFLVPSDLRGVSSRALPKMGLRTTPMGEIRFDDVRVPSGNRLGREGAGFAIFSSTIEWERSFMFASHVGAMERLLDQSLEHAGSRRQFGQAIGGFQGVAHQIADMKIRLELARLILQKAAWLKRNGRIALVEATMAKIFVSEGLVATAMAAVNIHGARGYLSEYGVERELRDALGGPIYAGTSLVQRGVLAELLGLRDVLSGPARKPGDIGTGAACDE